MTATVDFIINRVADALLVPNAALRFQPPTAKGTATAPVAKAGQEAESVGRLYVLEGGGAPRVLTVNKGESDGVMTVVNGVSYNFV